MTLIPVAEAQARLIALANPLPVETASLGDAAGRWAAEDVIARRTQPFADLSAMDGFAIRFAERPGPWTVIGESAAGSSRPEPLSPGQALRIFTGAPVPEGADVILVQEDATRNGDRLVMSGEGPSSVGKHIRPCGSDFAEGETLITAGTLLTPARIGLAATAGHGMLAVRRRVWIAIISTGNELVPPGTDTGGDRLPSSNAPMLAALLGGAATRITDLGIATDRLDAIGAAIDAARDADIIMTIGGASVGDHDLIKPALEAAGSTLDFWKVAMRPGKPLVAGKLGDAIVLGLPGNPVSAFVTATLFAKPVIAALSGAASPIPAPRTARLAAPVPANGHRTQYLRGRWVDGKALALDDQDSATLTALSASTLLIVRPANAAALGEGETVDVLDIA